MTFLTSKGTQIPVLTQQDTEKLDRVELTGVKRASATCETTKANLWLPGDKHMSSPHFAAKDHNENILGFNVLSSQTWQLMQSNICFSRSTLTLKGIQIPQCTHPTRRLPSLIQKLLMYHNTILCCSMKLNSWSYSWFGKDKSPPELTPHIIHRLIIRQTFTPRNSPVWLKTGTEMAINCSLLACRQGGTRFGEKRNANTDPFTTAVPNIKEPVTQLQGVLHSWMATLDVKYMFFVIPLQQHKAWFIFIWKHIFNRLLQG